MKVKKILQLDVVTVAVTAMLSILGGVTCSSPTTPSGVPNLSISGNRSLTVGQTSQLTLIATFSDGTSRTFTSQATWQSTNMAVATVSSTGLVTAVGLGQAIIQATLPPSTEYQGTTWTIQVTVV